MRRSASSLAQLLSLGVVLVVLGGCGDPSNVGSNPLPQPTGGGEGGGGEGGGGEGGAGVGGSGGAGGGITGPGSECGTGNLVKSAAPGKLLLRGTLVTPDTVFKGEILVESDTITCVAVSCADEPGAADASIVETNGVIFPGLIDTHNHVLFNTFDETHWTPDKVYTHASQWASGDVKYAAVRNAKQYLNGEQGSSIDRGCELYKWGGLKAVVSGTTSMVGATGGANKTCYRTLSRSITAFVNPNAPGSVVKVQVASIWPSATAANGVCANYGYQNNTEAYVIHVAEGVSQTARNEFEKLYTMTDTDGCLFDPRTTVVHGNALIEEDFDRMADHGMNLVWSPRSNVGLYGLGIDLTVTTDIPTALAKGINVALAPDWTMSGSQNILDELRFAKHVSDTLWDGLLTPKMLVEMVTINAARNIGHQAYLGSLEVGKKADIMVIGGNPGAPYESLIQSTPENVRLVLVNGVVLYGDANLQPTGAAAPGCELVEMCECSKFACVATTGQANNKFEQTYAVIEEILTHELEAYGDLKLTPYVLSPISPIYRCPQ